MPPISVLGVGSGLDLSNLVTQLVAAEGQPATNRLNRREAGLQAELSAIGTFRAALATFRTAARGLSSSANFRGLTATAGDESPFTARAGTTALPGRFGIEVRQLAAAQKLVSAPFAGLDDNIGSGTLTIRFGTFDAGAFTVNPERPEQTLVIEPGAGTLTGVRDAINAADLGVTATVIDDGSGPRLLVSGEATGTVNSLQITVADADGDNLDAAGLSRLAFDPAAAAGSGRNLSETVAARDAVVAIDGLTVTRPGNTLAGVLQGLTLELAAAAPGTVTDLVVARDTAAATAAVRSLVNAYNDLIGEIGGLTAFNPQTGERGPLLGDAGVRAVSGQLRRVLTSTVAEAPAELRSLTSLGVSFQRDGRVELDGAALEAAVNADPDGVATLAQGIGAGLEEVLSRLLGGGGVLSARTDSLNQQLDRLGDERERLALRLDALELRLRSQFAALDSLVSQLQATGSFLTQQLANLPSFTANRGEG